MPQLLLYVQGEQVRAVHLDGRRIRLGRSEGCEIAIDEDGVSRSHAVVFRSGADFVIEDLGSRNGTYVNDQRVERCRLSHGDRIRLAPAVELEFRSGGSVKTRLGKGRTERLLRRVTYCLVSGGRAAGSHPILLHSRVTTVGRQGAALVGLDDPSVSRLHARLDQEGSDLFVTDLKSSNGTRVNGEPVIRAHLADGDVVQFGNVAFEVRITSAIAWSRLSRAVGGALLLSAVVGTALWGVSHWTEWQSRRREEGRVRKQAVTSVSKGIASYRDGDAILAQSYFSYAVDQLIMAEIAPEDTRPEELEKIFRPIAGDLPAGDKGFDFAKASQVPREQVDKEARMPNREYVGLQCGRLAAALGQSPDVPPGFVDQVWGNVEEVMKYKGKFQTILDRSRGLNERLCEMLREAKLPEVFCYVAWVESALDPNATSPVKARGLWQFMAPTAREYGLKVDSQTDERTDVILSTRAAARMIGNLIRMFGTEQVMCALASYNRGEGAVRGAMRKIPDPMMESSEKFWYLVKNDLLPQETSEYVPRIFAYRILAESPGRFGLRRP
jgi:pSer/pThr/pTyr-binding forkhead associated (FHA) protein